MFLSLSNHDYHIEKLNSESKLLHGIYLTYSGKAFSFVGRGGENLIVDPLESESNYVNGIEEYYGLWYSYKISVKYL